MMTGTNTSRRFYHRIMPTGFCICSFQDSLRKTIALFLLVHGHARLSGRHVGDVCTGYAPKESFLNEGFYHSFHRLLPTLLSIEQILLVEGTGFYIILDLGMHNVSLSRFYIVAAV